MRGPEVQRGIFAPIPDKVLGTSSPFLICGWHAGIPKLGYCRLTKGEKTMQGMKGVIVAATLVAAAVAVVWLSLWVAWALFVSLT